MPRETDVRKEEERDMPREKETLRKVHAKGKRDVKKKMPSIEKDFKERACRERRMSGKRRAERIRALKKKTCQGKERRQEKDAKTSSSRDPGLLPACDLIIPLSQYDCKKIS